MLNKFLKYSLIFLSSWGVVAQEATQEQLVTQKEYVRMAKVADGDYDLQTSVRTLKSVEQADAPIIDLVGVMHIGEKSYYTDIQKCLDQADIVLFEGVGQPDCLTMVAENEEQKKEKTKLLQNELYVIYSLHIGQKGKLPQDEEEMKKWIVQAKEWGDLYWLDCLGVDAWNRKMTVEFLPATSENFGTLKIRSLGEDVENEADDVVTVIDFSSERMKELKQGNDAALQELLATSLGLVFQKKYIHYEQDNFEHCDISVSTLQKLMREPGEDGKPVDDAALQQMMSMMSGENKMVMGLIKFFANMLKANPQTQQMVRYVFARTLSGNDVSQLMRKQPNLEKMMVVILEKRNDYVMECLDVYLKDPQWKGKRIAVFYGAAHLADIENRLYKSYGYRLNEEVWYSGMKVRGITPQIEAMVDRMLNRLMKQ